MKSFRQLVLLTEMPMQAGSDVGLILNDDYNPSFFILIKDNAELKKSYKEYDYELAEKAIYGVMSIRHNEMYNALEVNKVWARQGYGPLLYYIAMTVAGKEGLMSTRVSRQVSAEAKNVWMNFATGVAKNQVTAIPLEAESPHHPEDYLNNKYVLNQPMNLSSFLARGKKAIGKDPYGERKTMIEEASEMILRGEMDKLYGDNN